MNAGEMRNALEPFDDETMVVIRLRVEGGGFFELAVKSIEYVRMTDARDAYLQIVPYQGEWPLTPPAP